MGERHEDHGHISGANMIALWKEQLESGFYSDKGANVVIVPRGNQKLLLLENSFSLKATSSSAWGHTNSMFHSSILLSSYSLMYDE